MLSLSACIALFIVVSAMVASVVASMRASCCSHFTILYFLSFLQCYLLVYSVLMSDVSTINN